jgi:replicative DNA helicase
MGKSALALNIAENVAVKTDNKGAILVFSREMSNEQNGMRLISSNAKVDSKKLKTGANLNGDDWNRIAQATDTLSASSIYLDDVSTNISQVVYEARALKKRHKGGLSLIIVDYLQLLEGTNERNREQEISKISRSMKSLAKELNIPIIQLSQLNRKLEERKDKVPILSDLRESGAIEQDSDIIIFIYRDEVYNEDSPDKGTADLIIAKHRNGATGVITVSFQGEYTKFANLSRQAA